MKHKIKLTEIAENTEQFVKLEINELMPLPALIADESSTFNTLSIEKKAKFETSLDGFLALGILKPGSKAEEDALIRRFLAGLEKLLDANNNWTFLQPLVLTLENCTKCQTCSNSCPVYVASGRQEAYRPTFRAEILRRIINKYIKKSFLGHTGTGDIVLNWTTIARLGELAYRCTLCRRCAQVCPISLDNGLIAHEIRKLFSQELGIAPKELHEQGTVKQLAAGSSTGVSPDALKNLVSFMEDEIEEKTGKKIKIPVDREDAETLLIHNAGEFLAWPENVEAFAILFDAAGLDWTLSSELVGYDAVNYGIWYDDIQAARIAIRHAEAARKLKVKRICVGECGHAHKALITIADRVLTGDLNIPRESALPLLSNLITRGKIKMDPSKNNFPVTLHDPCNMVRLMGIKDPQRQILRTICTQFREMTPHGVENYCCGGGSGFAIMQSMNFPDWRNMVSGRMKLKQILDTFQDVIDPSIKKYVCAPCSNCKGQIRGLFEHYGIWEKSSILYGGLVELMVNAMADIEKPFIEWEWH
jgi:Fe-S oxidoreductase